MELVVVDNASPNANPTASRDSVSIDDTVVIAANAVDSLGAQGAGHVVAWEYAWNNAPYQAGAGSSVKVVAPASAGSVPYKIRVTDDDGNVQGLCYECHEAKSKEESQRGRTRAAA